MENVNSNPYFNRAQLYQQEQTIKTPTLPQDVVERANATESTGHAGSESKNAFSNLFGDDELTKLQGNLEAIASLAERALKKIDS